MWRPGQAEGQYWGSASLPTMMVVARLSAVDVWRHPARRRPFCGVLCEIGGEATAGGYATTAFMLRAMVGALCIETLHRPLPAGIRQRHDQAANKAVSAAVKTTETAIR